MEWTKEIKDKIEKLDSKYASMGQDLPAYLDGFCMLILYTIGIMLMWILY